MAASSVMQFNPAPALLGGLCLGLASLAKFAIRGRILGISGALKGFVQGRITPWRVLFTAGMLGGALVAKSVTPDAFDVLPATFTVRLWILRAQLLCQPRRGALMLLRAVCWMCWTQPAGLHPH